VYQCCEVLGVVRFPPRPRCRCLFCARRRQEIGLASRLACEMTIAERKALRNDTQE
jgi:hypothetical protein